MSDTTIRLEKGKFNDPVEFFDKFLTNIKESIGEGIENYTSEVEKLAKSKIDVGDVPGSFSESWKQRKKELGLKTESFQRLGRGDVRSYYENITTKKGRGKLWFVGIPKGKAAYKVSKSDEGTLMVKRAKDPLWRVAKDLEEGRYGGAKPFWTEIALETQTKLLNHLHMGLAKSLRLFGAGDAS